MPIAFAKARDTGIRLVRRAALNIIFAARIYDMEKDPEALLFALKSSRIGLVIAKKHSNCDLQR
jgi:hypothetical protein